MSGELAAAADPDIADAVRLRGVENRDVGPDRRDGDDRVAGARTGSR